MEKRIEIPPSGKRWSRAPSRLIVCLSIVVPALAIVTAAFCAATPKAGCWGTCGGPEGPLNGVFVVRGVDVTNFEYSESCLGTTKDGTDYLHIVKPLTVSKTGVFAYKGNATVSNLSSPKALYATPVTLTGMFKTATVATVTIATAHTGCPSKQLPMHFVG
jgi:hypothetical protein